MTSIRIRGHIRGVDDPSPQILCETLHRAAIAGGLYQELIDAEGSPYRSTLTRSFEAKLPSRAPASCGAIQIFLVSPVEGYG